jgi:leucyl-tRNA synthetase
MFESWYDNQQQKARPVAELEAAFAHGGSAAVDAACGDVEAFTAEQWNAFSVKEKAAVRMQYRIAYQ